MDIQDYFKKETSVLESADVIKALKTKLEGVASGAAVLQAELERLERKLARNKDVIDTDLEIGKLHVNIFGGTQFSITIKDNKFATEIIKDNDLMDNTVHYSVTAPHIADNINGYLEAFTRVNKTLAKHFKAVYDKPEVQAAILNKGTGVDAGDIMLVVSSVLRDFLKGKTFEFGKQPFSVVQAKVIKYGNLFEKLGYQYNKYVKIDSLTAIGHDRSKSENETKIDLKSGNYTPLYPFYGKGSSVIDLLATVGKLKIMSVRGHEVKFFLTGKENSELKDKMLITTVDNFKSPANGENLFKVFAFILFNSNGVDKLADALLENLDKL